MVVSKAELVGFALVVGYALYGVCSAGMQVSQRTRDQYDIPGLHKGWMADRPMDLSDYQWKEFRKSMPLLGAAIFSFAGLSRGVHSLGPLVTEVSTLAFSLVFLGVCHGSAAVIVLVLLLVHYWITQGVAGKRYGPALFWLWPCSTLVMARVYEGFPLASLG